jgi:hypothetical protein
MPSWRSILRHYKETDHRLAGTTPEKENGRDAEAHRPKFLVKQLTLLGRVTPVYRG